MNSAAAASKPGWRTLARAMRNRKTGFMALFGFASGLPFALFLGTLYAWLTEAEVEGDFAPLDELVGKTTPILTCFDPEATAYRQRRTFFGTLEDNPVITKIGFNRFEKQFQILSVF